MRPSIAMKKTYGFTLMELLIVLAILVALIAVLSPIVFGVFAKWNIQQAKMSVDKLTNVVGLYAAENNGAPTNEQGLYALVYIPDNVGVVPQVPVPGQFGTMGNEDPSFSGMSGGSVSAGPDALNQTSPGFMDPATSGMNMGGMTMGGTDPVTGMPMSDPMAGGMTSAWTQTVHNPQLYLQQRIRSLPYMKSVKDLMDPWRRPYRYDNSRQHWGVNMTGSDQPAIWSAGPDGIDGNDDDIRNWDPVEAQQALLRRQQQMQFQGGGMGQGMDMISPDMMPNPMGGGMPNPMGGGMPNPMGGGMPNPTGGGMPTPPM